MILDPLTRIYTDAGTRCGVGCISPDRWTGFSRPTQSKRGQGTLSRERNLSSLTPSYVYRRHVDSAGYRQRVAAFVPTFRKRSELQDK